MKPLTPFLLVLSLPTGAWATDYFVSPEGSDAGDGSIGRPWQTIEKALGIAEPGDRVVLRGGEYRLAQALRFPRPGQPGKPITVTAHQDEYVALLGSVRLTGWELLQGRIWKCKAPLQEIKGLYEDSERLTHPRERGVRENPPVSAIQGPGQWTQQGGWVYLWTREGDSPDNHRIEASQHGVVNMDRPWLRLEKLHILFGQPTGLVIYADNCEAVSCEVAHVSNSVDNAYGAYLSGCSNSAFRNCVVHDSYYWGDHGSNSHVVSCIDCGDRGPNFVEGCEIFNGGLGVGTKGAAREMVIRDCLIYDVLNGVVTSGERASGPGAGKTDRGHYVVYGNHIRDCRVGVYFYSGDTHDNRILNNVIQRCGNGVHMRKVDGIPDRPTIANNVFLECGTAMFLVAERNGSETLSQYGQAGLKSHHNLFFGNQVDWCNPLSWTRDLTKTFTEMRTYENFGWEEGSIGADPLLDEWGRATAGSPTISAGAAVDLPDYIAKPAAWHIGIGPWPAGQIPPEPGLTLSIAGSQDSVSPGQEVKLCAILKNEFRDKEVPLQGDAIVTFHFRYANVWYYDRQELWRVRVQLPGTTLKPGETLDLRQLPGWKNPTNAKLGDEFHLRADDQYWKSGCRLRATVRLIKREEKTPEALQRIEPLLRSKEVLRVRVT